MAMKYDLMHKDVPVAEVVLDDDGYLARVDRVLCKEHLPVGTCVKGFLDGNAIRHWWSSRSIPASRSGIRDALYRLGIRTTGVLLERCMGLSLSDQYWIRRSGDDVEWADVNFFDNAFSEDVGDLLFGNTYATGEFNFCSPDNTSDGVLNKRWKIVDGERHLLKAGSGQVMQEPFNEVIATMLMESQEVECCHYDLVWIGGYPYCSCRDFINSSQDLVTASNLLASSPRRNDESAMGHFIRLCGEAGIDAVPFLDRMLVVDYIMMNNDRHLSNFGLIRDAITLDYVGMAPIYDTGTALGCLLRTGDIPLRLDRSCKPFAKDFDSQLSLVSSLDWFDPDAAMGILPDVESLLSLNGFIGEERASRIKAILSDRIDRVSSRL